MTTKRNTNSVKKKSAGYNLIPLMIFLVFLCISLTIYIGYRTTISERKLFSLSIIAIFGGLLFESIRISGNWGVVFFKFIGAFIFSLICFIPGKTENVYNFENHIEFWPYCFIFLFSIFTAIFNEDKVTAKLTEGITLLQSLSIIYWTIDYGFLNIDNWFIIILIIIALLFSFFSITHSLTYFNLSRIVRLVLSIWSTIIMVAFAADNIYNVYQNEDIESTKYISQGIFITIQYFLLGVSAIYITQNYMLLARFLPSKNGNYKNDLKEIKKVHIDRYSENQVSVKHSILCIFYTVIIYSVNYKFQILPRHTMIWFVFLTFPLIIKLFGIGYKKNKAI